MTRYNHLKPTFFIALTLVLGVANVSHAKKSYRSSKHTVNFRSTDAKSFYKSLSYQLEQMPPDNVTTISARSSMAELLFQTGNYRDAAQIFLQLTESPLADQYKLSSFQYRLGECYFHMGLYSEAYDQ